VLDVPLELRKGSRATNVESAMAQAADQLRFVARTIGRPDLDEVSLLDIGCGVKFSQAILNGPLPIGAYHGVDVDGEMIAFLASTVRDPRFSYHHIDVHNRRYNRRGAPLTPDTDIGAGGRRFDVVGLFSVFSHLEPHDYRAMLALARRYVADGGKLVFTTFIRDGLCGDYEDENPAKPLLRALYREDAVRRYAEDAGWRVERIVPPKRAQHYVVCAAA
jgi:SAM-dependent methyltransferase